MGRLRGKLASSQDRWWGVHTIINEDGREYMTRYWIGRLRLHVFHRGDYDPDCHDHPWDFYTFPLTSYVEEVLERTRQARLTNDAPLENKFYRTQRVVKRFRLHFRPAEHCHRVLGAWAGRYEHYSMFTGQNVTKNPQIGSTPMVAEGKKIVTLVWQCGVRRKWGFWKDREGRWCWQGWKDYVLAGGKNAPCE
jgi:hypothetical protein